MRYDIHLFKAEIGDTRNEFVCRSFQNRMRENFSLTREVDFKDEDDMRRKLRGVLPLSDVESTIKTLNAWSKHVLDFFDVELTEEQAESLGWRKGKQK
jgi:hypothetical protein